MPGHHQMTSRRAALGVVALAVAALALVGCGADETSGQRAEGVTVVTELTLVEGEEVRVSAIDHTFRPEETTVAAGTVVRWTNDGRTGHNVLPIEGDAWGVEETDFEPDDEYTFRFTEPGTYDYYCSLHGTTTAGMVGTIIVEG